MICPNCGHENPGDASYCANCNRPLTNPQEFNSNQPVQVKVSRLAMIALSLALYGVIFACLLPVTVFYPRLHEFGLVFYYICIICLISAIILGIVSVISIGIYGDRITGGHFAVGAIIVPIITFLILGMFLPAFARASIEKYRMSCGTNLSAIGKAMLIYANDYDEKFPRAGGKTSAWGYNINWNAQTRQQAFNIDSNDTAGAATISSSLYLLVKYSGVLPEKFICAEDRKVSKFDPAKYGIKDPNLTRLWDFGPKPWKHNSYSYHMSYGPYSLTMSSDPGMAVAADRNPWIPSLGWKVKSFQEFNPKGEREKRNAGNSPVHSNEGQNVLYLDSHVNFENVAFCGVNKDNIYTSWNGDDIRKGTPPKVGSQPADKLDSLLVNDPPVNK